MTLMLTSTRFGIVEKAFDNVALYQTDEVGIGKRADDWVFYAAQVRPYYDQINGIIGQLAGLLILGQARSCFEAYYNLASTPLDQIEDCRCGLVNIRPPIIAVDHYNHLLKAAAHVDEIARSLCRSINSPEQLRLALPQMVTALEAACAMLRCAADPVVRLQTIDFAQGCACCMPIKEPNAFQTDFSTPNKNKR
jgi:hypothetical protein